MLSNGSLLIPAALWLAGLLRCQAWVWRGKKNNNKETSTSFGRWEQSELCHCCRILGTCLLCKLAQFSVRTFMRWASSVVPWDFQTMPASVQNDLCHGVLFRSPGGTISNCLLKLQGLGYFIFFIGISSKLKENVVIRNNVEIVPNSYCSLVELGF